MERSRRQNRVRWGRPQRWGTIPGAVAMALGVVLILAPNAAASSTKKITAPYPGEAYGDTNFLFTGCGGSASESAPPVFNLTSGHVTFAYKVGQVSCGKGLNSTDAETYTYLEISPLALATGHQTIETNWKATFTVNLVATPGSGSQFAEASFEVYGYAYVYDTNGTIFGQTAGNSFGTEITTSTFSKTYTNYNFHDWVNGTFNSSHTYDLLVYFQTYLFAEVSSGSSSASASLSMASSTHRAILESIVIS